MASFSFYTTMYMTCNTLFNYMYVCMLEILVYIKYTFIMHFIQWYNIAYNSDPHLSIGSLSGTHIHVWKVISTKLNTFRAEESTLSVGTTYTVHRKKSPSVFWYVNLTFQHFRNKWRIELWLTFLFKVSWGNGPNCRSTTLSHQTRNLNKR